MSGDGMKQKPLPMWAWPQAVFQAAPRFAGIRPIGQGGMGVVYRAFDRARGEDVALKVVPRDVGDPTALFHEFEILRAIDHPNVVRAHELLEDEKSIAISMELIEGVDLLSYVRGPRSDPGPPPDVERLRQTFATLARTLRAVHEHGFFHGDVKPANVIVSPTGEVKLLAFEVAQREPYLSDNTAPVISGTPAYMAPEVIEGAQYRDGRVDLYAVGIMLHEALTGVLPWKTEGSLFALLQRKLQTRPTSPSEIVPGIPPDLDMLCRRLLAKEPEARADADFALNILEVAMDRRHRGLSRLIYVGPRK